MNRVTGSMYPLNIPAVGATFDTDGHTNYFSLTTSSALNFYTKFAIQEQSIQDNTLGLYSHIVLDRDDRARFMNMTGPAHIFSSRKNGCTWSPKGKILLNVNEFGVCPIQAESELCPDAYWNSCLERIFAAGDGILDLMGTPEGRALMNEVVYLYYRAQGNSMNALAWYAEHPDIDTINTSGLYDASPEEWTAYYDQQMSGTCAGWMTQLDALKTEGRANYNVTLPNSDFAGSNPVTGAFTGDIIALLERLIASAGPTFKNAIKYGVTGRGVATRNGKVFPIIKLTSVLYQAFQKYIRTTYVNIPQGYFYTMTNNDGENINVIGALEWNNLAITEWEEPGIYDSITGSTSHRAGLFMPGLLGLATDVRDIRQFTGMGLRIVQRLEAPYKGMTYMSSYLKWGAGIGDVDFGAMASNVTLPA